MERELKVIRNILSIMLAVLVCYLLMALESLLAPLALALFIAVLLQPALAWFEQKNVRFGVSLGVIGVSSVAVLGLCSSIVYSTAHSLLSEKDRLIAQLDAKLASTTRTLADWTGKQMSPEQAMEGLSGLITDWLQASAGQLATLLGDFTSMAFMTLLYLLIFLGGILQYEHYLQYLRADRQPNQEESALINGFEEVKNSIVTYVKIKFFVSLITGISYSLICLALGIDFAIFWGFLAFILNFIPTIGSVLATIPPILLGLVQLDSAFAIVALITLLLVAQSVIGNVIEPRMMGASLSLNTVTVLLGLVFWGKLWGITGMVLSVPLLVLMKVILAQIPDARILVRLMGSADDLGKRIAAERVRTSHVSSPAVELADGGVDEAPGDDDTPSVSG